MIAAGTYTVEEIANILGISANRRDKIKEKLKKLNINYSTSGRGEATQFLISGGIEIINFKQFAIEYLGIKPRFIERLDQFVSLLLDDNAYCPIVQGSLVERVNLDEGTVKKWLNALVKCGLLKIEPFKSVYYATTRSEKEFIDDDMIIYEYTKLIRQATKQEYDESIKIWNGAFSEYMSDYITNFDKVEEEGYIVANTTKLDFTGGWNIMKNDIYYVVNKEWEHLDELKPLLSGYNGYMRKHKGNIIKDIENSEKRHERIMKLKAERKKALEFDKYIDCCEYYENMPIEDAYFAFIQANKHFAKDLGYKSLDRNFLLSLNGFKTDNTEDIQIICKVFNSVEQVMPVPYIDIDRTSFYWRFEWLIDFSYEDGIVRVKDLAKTTEWENELNTYIQDLDRLEKEWEEENKKKMGIMSDDEFIELMEKAAEKQNNNYTIYYESPEIGNGNFTYDGLVKALKDEEKAKEIWNKNVCEYYRK